MEKSITKELKSIDSLIRKKIDQSRPSGIGPNSMNMTHFQIMKLLFKNQDKEICQKDIEEEIKLKKASITGAIDTLVDRGFVERKISKDDARKRIIVLTSYAKKKENELRDTFEKINKIITRDISEKELTSFYKTLDKMKENLKKDIY